MASSLSKIQNQIQKLQKQAAAIPATVLSRIKRENAQHGLTPSDLFDSEKSSGGFVVGNGLVGRSKTASKPRTPGAQKPAKFPDGQGNTWHGISKRPQWIHAALESGRSLEEFLIGKHSAPPSVAKAFAKPAKKAEAKQTARAAKTASPQASPAKKSAKGASVKPAAPKQPAAKKYGKTSAPVKATAKAPANNAPANKAATKKTAAKKTASNAAVPSSAAETSAS